MMMWKTTFSSKHLSTGFRILATFAKKIDGFMKLSTDVLQGIAGDVQQLKSQKASKIVNKGHGYYR